MKKTVVALLHLGFWACYLILVMVVLGIFFSSNEQASEKEMGNLFMTLMFFAILPSILTFYTYYFILFPKYIIQKKILSSILYGLLFSLLAGVFGFGSLWLMFGVNCGLEEGWDIEIVLFIAFISTISGVIALIIQGFITWFEEIKLKETLQQKNQEMELALVKAQLDPHFLFNTINNIDVLILKDADMASEYLNKLSDIMRFMLYETKAAEIPISKELQYIEKYIELQKIRTANASYVNYSVEGSHKNRTIAPMIFIPFIENAFKHTNNKKLENAITIQVLIQKNSIEFICNNKFDESRKTDNHNGLGIDLIQKRLNLIYPNQHKLTITNQDSLYSVHLILKSNAPIQ